jgi:hypothetical protein
LSAVAVAVELTVDLVVVEVKYAKTLLKPLMLDRPLRLPSAPVVTEAPGLLGDPLNLTVEQQLFLGQVSAIKLTEEH